MDGETETLCCCSNQETHPEKCDAEYRVNVTCIWSSPSWNSFVVRKAPPTIRYLPNFITEEEEKFLLSKVYSVPKPKWQQLLRRRLQNWGGFVSKEILIPDDAIPLWLNSVIGKLMTLGDTFPSDNRPNHVLINEYLPGQGIMAHTDGPAFYPMVATVSLGSDTVIDYYKPIDPERNNAKQDRYVGSVLLERRSLILVSDDAYAKYLHEIADRLFDVITSRIFNLESINRSIGEVMTRDLRVSLTIRNVPKVSKITTSGLIIRQ